MSRRVNVLLGVFFLIVFATGSHRLATIDRRYYREEVRIDAMPAWLVLPVAPPTDRFGPPEPSSPPPLLVIVQHGFSASRQAMSWLVRGLVHNGFAVLAADFRGHGQNATPFNFSGLGDDIASLIEYAGTRPEVDAHRIALVGHSMGAAAVYLYAVQHEGIDAVVPISGSGLGGGTSNPRNALLILASNDPQRIHVMSRAAMSRLSGTAVGALPAASGDLAAGTARRLVEVPGHDHVSILFSEVPVREIVDWLRGTWSLPAAPFQAAPPGILREGIITILTGFLIIFPLAGFLAGAVLRTRPIPGAPKRGAVWVLGASMLVAGVVLFGGTPLSFLPYAAGNELVSFFLIAGGVYAVWVGWGRTPMVQPWSERLRAALLGAAAFAVVYATYGVAVSRVFFNITLSGQRSAWFAVVAVMFLPLGIGLEVALRPPGDWRAVLRSLAAKLLILVGLTVAINDFGTLPPVIGLMIPALAITLPLMEAVAARLYTVSGNPVASGVFTALFLAWFPAAIFPIGY